MLIIAIGLGEFNSTTCVYDSETQEQLLETLTTERGYFKSLFNSYQSGHGRR